MSNQVIKKQIPNHFLFNFLEHNCLKKENYYVFERNSYKRSVFNKTVNNFLEDIKGYYFVSKQKKYIERKLTYNSFTTVMRQMCKMNNILYKTEIKYDKSNYDIIYYIYFSDNSSASADSSADSSASNCSNSSMIALDEIEED